jgi:ABC-type antimicrobial peptide transport system permease subunit
VRQVDPALVVGDLRTLDDQLDRALVNERLLATLASAFAALAVALAVVGLYGVTSFAVSRRTREIGIRLALGASRRSAFWFVLRDTAIMVAAGLGIAVPAVWALGRVVESQLFGVRFVDAMAVGGAVFLIGAVALAGSAVFVRRAASVNPVEALRCE